MNHILLLAVMVALLASIILAAELPPGGKSVFADDVLVREGGIYRMVEVEGPGFTRALEADVPQASQHPWGTQLHARTPVAIQRGDVLHIRFYARNVFSMTGQANLGVVFELNEAPHTKSADVQLAVGSEWTEVDIPFVAKQDFAADGSQLAIRLGYAQQKLQIGGLQVLNYGNSVKVADLPRLRLDYVGRDKDAPWRKEAMQRIEELRKETMVVRVVDAAGRPVQGARVSASLQQHAFGFGTCISMRLLGDGPDAEKYRETVKTVFTEAVTENELKWPNIVRHEYKNSDAMVKWLNDNGIPTRGHCLVWPGTRFMPRHVLEMSPAEMKAAIEKHVTETTARYKGQLIDWDVINEPFSNHYVMDQLGNEVMVDWFKLAHAADPDVRLYINDYAILASGNMLDTPHQRHYYDTIKYLKDNGAPIHGIGMQGHFGGAVTSPENILKILDRYATFGLPIKVTELDLNIDDEELRTDYMRDLHIALFSHPAVEAILHWGFWEGSHWIPNAALYRRDWTIRPHGQAFLDLVHGEWKTRVQGQVTDDAGKAEFRGFLGSYEVRVTDAAGRAHQATATLERGGSEAVVELR